MRAVFTTNAARALALRPTGGGSVASSTAAAEAAYNANLRRYSPGR